ncbi:sigma-70 family RNA polymerase sigma factor [Labrys sp. WJW]|uniref:sigma-70 family RNA polymerase sigma factor n=1 Tax=Labrys sp. WJW TaxID=1737983 RepID=UPI001FDA5048|nr:sigma-70 family RNA polymerase sigma factor [Labrys sp. WJW]
MSSSKGIDERERTSLESRLRAVAAGDRAAFRNLYDATQSKLYGVVLRILRDRPQADDALQEIYVRIWDKAADFDPNKASAMTWMATIARNRAIDLLRSARPLAGADAQEIEDLPAEASEPLEARHRSEELQRLLACLAGLDEERRQMILLAYYRGATREALSRRFERPVPTVKTLLHRGLAQLRECLGHD